MLVHPVNDGLELVLAHFPWSILNTSVAEEYSFAKQVESSTSVHLPFEHLDPVHMPFDSAGTVRQSQPVSDRGVIDV